MKKFCTVLNQNEICINKTNKILLSILLFILILALPIVHFTNGTMNPFFFRQISYSYDILENPILPINDPNLYDRILYYAPAGEINLIIISQLLGIPPKTLQFIPFLGIPLIFSLLYFAKKIIPSKSLNLKILAVFIVIYSIGRSTEVFFTMWPHSWAFLLFPIVLALLYDNIRIKSVEKIIVFLIIFIAIHFYSYTVEMWTVSVCFLLSLIIILSKLNNQNHFEIVKTDNLSLITLVIMFTFNRMIYYHYLPNKRFEFEIAISSISEYFQKYFIQNSEINYHYTIPALYSYANLLLLISILIPIIVGGFKLIPKILIGKYDSKRYTISWMIIIIATLGVAFVDVLIYSIGGVITVRYILFMFPLVSVAFLWTFFDKKSLKYFFLVTMLLLSAIGPILSYSYEGIINTSPLKYAEFEPDCNWLLNHQNGMKERILGDQPTIEKFSLESTIMGKPFEKLYFNDTTYKLIVSFMGKTPKPDKIADFVVLNIKFNRIDTVGWIQYEPFTKHLNEINNNANFNKIYSDNILWVMKP